MTLTLPWPPSVNSYWRAIVRGKHATNILSVKGRVYRCAVVLEIQLARVPTVTGRLAVLLEVYPPDRRRRDLDNLPKAILDALQHAGVYEDDSQIDDLHIVRREIEKPGRVVVTIHELQPPADPEHP